MRYHLSDDQVQIRDVVSAFLTDRYDHHVREGILKTPGGWSPEIWHALAEEIGVLGLTFPEAAGGMDGDATDALLLMDAFGEALVVEPYLQTGVIGAALLCRASSDTATRLMEDAVAGRARFALAMDEPGARHAPLRSSTIARRTGNGFVIDGRKTMVVGAPAATHLFVTARVDGEDGLAVFVVAPESAGVSLKSGRTLDGRGVAEIELDGCAVDKLAMLVDPQAGADVVAAVIDAGIAALCAEASGVMRRMIRDTLSYLEQRKQFGSALIDFQVLQHRLADMQVRLEQVEALAFFAAGILSASAERRATGISAAKAFVGPALRSVAQEAVQMHGAMGITEELAIGHLFKRATAIENEMGSSDYHLSRVVEAGLPVESLSFG